MKKSKKVVFHPKITFVYVVLIDFFLFFYQSDMQRGVHGRFLDQSTSVREAAIELVGKFILIQPDLIPNYYDMLSDRILVSIFKYPPKNIAFK